MSKFNQSATIRTTNREGHAAYEMSCKEKLVHQVLTSFINESKFYGDNTKDLIGTLKSVIRKDPRFVSNLAVFARREFNMRSVSHVLAGYLANMEEGKPFVRQTVDGIVLRGDDATEILAFYLTTFGKPIPNSLRRALRNVFSRFDAYTLAKYKGEGNTVKMRDILCLCRPAPKDAEQSALWKSLLEGTIPTPYTWESELSAHGNNKETWEGLIASGKVGYMALIRNLRNIIDANPNNLDAVLQKISDPESVHRSKQLPFRFLSAYKNLPLNAGSKVMNALEDAATAAVDNLPKLPGLTVIAVDVSGSMSADISAKSDIRCCEISTMLGVIANRICENAIFWEFNNRLYDTTFPSKAPILYATTHEAKSSGGTSMELPFEAIRNKKILPDRVIVISDHECNGGYYNRTVQQYADMAREAVGKDFWVHAIDLQGYGTQQFAGPKTNLIAGWSEKVFEFILLAEQGEGSLVKTISEYTWDK